MNHIIIVIIKSYKNICNWKCILNDRTYRCCDQVHYHKKNWDEIITRFISVGVSVRVGRMFRLINGGAFGVVSLISSSSNVITHLGGDTIFVLLICVEVYTRKMIRTCKVDY